MSASDIAPSVDVDLSEIKKQAAQAAEELIDAAGMKPGQILVVGCSSSEIAAHKIGCYSSAEVGQAVFDALRDVCQKHSLYLAAQCCEHLNRAVILEEDAAIRYHLEMVNVIPRLKAGGSFATAAWNGMEHPCAVESIKAHAGIDIGDTLIGMHLRPVAVPVRTSIKEIGSAHVVCAEPQKHLLHSFVKVGYRYSYVVEIVEHKSGERADFQIVSRACVRGYHAFSAPEWKRDKGLKATRFILQVPEL